jgi:nucleotide-binding universal stress UspA family protein
MINTIVVGTDGSSHGQNAVTWTAELARQLGARVVLVHVAPPMVGTGGYVMYVPQDVVDQTSADLQERVITEFCEPLRAADGHTSSGGCASQRRTWCRARL